MSAYSDGDGKVAFLKVREGKHYIVPEHGSFVLGASRTLCFSMNSKRRPFMWRAVVTTGIRALQSPQSISVSPKLRIPRGVTVTLESGYEGELQVIIVGRGDVFLPVLGTPMVTVTL